MSNLIVPPQNGAITNPGVAVPTPPAANFGLQRITEDIQAPSADEVQSAGAGVPQPAYSEPEVMQIFSSRGFRGKEFILYQTQNNATGKWEARIMSAHENRMVPDMVIHTSDTKLTRADFGRQQPAWQGLVAGQELLNSPNNIRPMWEQGREGNIVTNTLAGGLLGTAMGTIKTVVGIPEGLVRPALWLSHVPNRMMEMLEDALLPGDQTRTGTDNPLNIERLQRMSEDNWAVRKVQGVENAIGDFLNIDTTSTSYQVGSFLTGIALAKLGSGQTTPRASGAPRLTGHMDTQGFMQTLRHASVNDIVSGLARVPDEALQSGFTQMPQARSTIMTKLRQAPRNAAAQQAMARINNLGNTVTPPRNVTPQTDITAPGRAPIVPTNPGAVTPPPVGVTPPVPTPPSVPQIEPAPASVPSFDQTFDYMTHQLSPAQKDALRPILQERVAELEPEQAYEEMIKIVNDPKAVDALYDEAATIAGQNYSDAAMTINGKSPTVLGSGQDAAAASQAFSTNSNSSLDNPDDTFAIPIRIQTDFGPVVAVAEGTAGELNALLMSPAFNGLERKAFYDPDLARVGGRTIEGIRSALDPNRGRSGENSSDRTETPNQNSSDTSTPVSGLGGNDGIVPPGGRPSAGAAPDDDDEQISAQIMNGTQINDTTTRATFRNPISWQSHGVQDLLQSTNAMLIPPDAVDAAGNIIPEKMEEYGLVDADGEYTANLMPTAFNETGTAYRVKDTPESDGTTHYLFKIPSEGGQEALHVHRFDRRVRVINGDTPSYFYVAGSVPNPTQQTEPVTISGSGDVQGYKITFPPNSVTEVVIPGGTVHAFGTDNGDQTTYYSIHYNDAQDAAISGVPVTSPDLLDQLSLNLDEDSEKRVKFRDVQLQDGSLVVQPEPDPDEILDGLFAELDVTDSQIQREASTLLKSGALNVDQVRTFLTNARPGVITTDHQDVMEEIGIATDSVTVAEARDISRAAVDSGRLRSRAPQTNLNIGFLAHRDSILTEIVQRMYDTHQHGGGTICLDCNTTAGAALDRALGAGSYSDRNPGASFDKIVRTTARAGKIDEGLRTFIFNVPQSVDSPPEGISAIPYYLTTAPDQGAVISGARGPREFDPKQPLEITPYYYDRSDPENPRLFFPAVFTRTTPREMIRAPMSIPVNAMPQLAAQSRREGGLDWEALTSYILPSEVPYMGMAGFERDLKSIYQLFHDVSDENAAGLSRISLGLVSGDPVKPDAFEAFKVAVSWVQHFEDQTGRRLGGIGVGETTIAKEGVIPFLTDTIDLANPEHMENIKSYIRGIGETGAATILHADIGATPMAVAYEIDRDGNYVLDDNGERIPRSTIMMTTESDNANYDKIKEVIAVTDAPVIWAHFGGIGRTQKATFEHLGKIEDLLEEAETNPDLKNVYIDLSWDIVSEYFVGNPALAQTAAKLIKKFPHRFLYGSDTVAGDGSKHNALRDYLEAGVFDNLTIDEFAMVMFGNANEVIGRSSADVRQWMDANREELQELRVNNSIVKEDEALEIMHQQRTPQMRE